MKFHLTLAHIEFEALEGIHQTEQRDATERESWLVKNENTWLNNFKMKKGLQTEKCVSACNRKTIQKVGTWFNKKLYIILKM